MFRVMNEYMRNINLKVNDKFTKKLDSTLKASENISTFCITVNFNRYIVDIRLKDYTVNSAKEEYERLIENISCDYSQMSVRYNEGKAVRYRFATCEENKDGYYCDVVISQEL